MRGKVLLLLDAGVVVGITPAYAGKRGRDSFCKDIRWDHPRVCGEKSPAFSMIEIVSGSPPRMRGKGCEVGCFSAGSGITPAYAGKRRNISSRSQYHKDHPRVCGEKPRLRAASPAQQGSPPRMRGKAGSHTDANNGARITPAYAGKSLTILQLTTGSRDHPRVCGEKTPVRIFCAMRRGSPPRMRGKVEGIRTGVQGQGITPAYAGKSVHDPDGTH